MDFFSRVGAVEAVQGRGFRARVQWKQDGQQRQCRGPCRAHEQTAQEDLQILRDSAEYKSRKKGFEGYRRRRVANRPLWAAGCVDKVNLLMKGT